MARRLPIARPEPRRRRDGRPSPQPRDRPVAHDDLPDLLRALASRSVIDRRRSVHALGVRGRAAARRALERALSDRDAGVRLGAASALGTIGDARSRVRLEASLHDPHWNVRAQAAYALSRIAAPGSWAPLAERLELDESALVRNACALALAHLRDRRAVPALEHALEDESDRVRREAVIALERSGDPDAAAKVRRLLNDPARRVRIAAAVVLGVRRDRAAVPNLLERLRRSEPWERPALVVALGRIGAPKSSSALARAADDPMRSVRVCAVHALAQMRSVETRRVARAKLTDGSWAVRGAAALALGPSGTPADAPLLTPLYRDPHPWPRRCALYAVGELGARDALPLVRRALDDRDPEVRLAAVWALGRLDDVGSEARLLDLLRRTHPRARRARTTLSAGEGAVRLLSDAETRIFDALVETVGSLARTSRSPDSVQVLRELERTLPPEELARPARRPTPLGADRSGLTLRDLFVRVRRPAESEGRRRLDERSVPVPRSR